MTRSNRTRTRRGFTLIELLVVMALIATLASIAMVVAPSAMDKDRAATAVTQIQSALQISRARAIRDGLPRGVRFVWNGSAQTTEYQYIESPPVFVPNPGGPLPVLPYVAAPGSPQAPYVQFSYTLAAGGSQAVASRACSIANLTPDHQAQVVVGGTLYLPTLGTWHTITAVSGTNPMSLTLNEYPDQQLGAAISYRTYHFGLYGSPRTLLGEPTLPLPQYTSVDLNLSSPAGTAGANYDVLFAPSGQLVPTTSTGSNGQVFLWVRDPTRQSPAAGSLVGFQQGGEQMIVVIKAKTGALGAAPANWDVNSANWYDLAKKAISGQ